MCKRDKEWKREREREREIERERENKNQNSSHSIYSDEFLKIPVQHLRLNFTVDYGIAIGYVKLASLSLSLSLLDECLLTILIEKNTNVL